MISQGRPYGRVALTRDQLESATALLVAAHEHDRPIHDAAMTALAARLKRPLGDLLAEGATELALDDLRDLDNLAGSLVTAPLPPPERLTAGLTPRELEVLRLLVPCAATHRERDRRVRNRHEAATLAARHGLI